MENELILLDTSVLIDFYRKTNKANSFFYQLSNQYQNFGISVVTKYEILSSTTKLNPRGFGADSRDTETQSSDNQYIVSILSAE